MMSLLAAMHALAAPRGEGLRPQLVNLLEGSKPALEEDRVEPGSYAAPPEPDPHENRYASRPKRKETVSLDRRAEVMPFLRSVDTD
jgi:hypothetical protein